MKQKKKKQKEKTSFFKKTSYIGVLTFLVAGLISILSVRYATRTLVPSEKDLSVTLPPAPTLLPTQPAPPTVPSEPSPLPEAEEAEPVMSRPEPFQMQRPSEGDIIKPFSVDTLLYSKTLSDWRTHDGIDFSAVTVKSVIAAADGMVEKAYHDPLMGYTIIIAHQEDFRTIYQNLTTCDTVAVGDTVTKGQIIGEGGGSAAAEGQDVPHLHFMLTKNNNVLNPLDYFSLDN